MEGGAPSEDSLGLTGTISHIAGPGLEASDAKDELGLVEEDDGSPSLILNLLSFMLPRATSAALFQARFWRWVYTY